MLVSPEHPLNAQLPIYSAHASMAPYLASFGLSLGRVRKVRQHIKSLIANIDAPELFADTFAMIHRKDRWFLMPYSYRSCRS